MQTISIQGMTCAGCAQSVTRALSAVAGVTAVDVSLANNTAQVTGDPVDRAALIAAVEAAGFDAQ